MIKTYQTINDINLTTSVDVSGKRVVLKFIGGSVSADGKVLKFGCFSTGDSDLQVAIEKDGGYNKSFKFASESKVITAEKVPKVTLADRKEIAGVTNTNAAIEWIEANTEHKFTGRPSKEEVVSVADSLKINFSDWKQ